MPCPVAGAGVHVSSKGAVPPVIVAVAVPSQLPQVAGVEVIVTMGGLQLAFVCPIQSA